MYNVIMHYLNSFFVMLNQKLESSLSCLFTIKSDVLPFYKFQFPQWSFSMKAITKINCMVFN